MKSHMSRLPAPWGSRINRKQPVAFTFAGARVQGFAGDTVTSAVFADPDQPDYLARSFKYHRPRSILLGRGLDANQYVNVDGIPNISADSRQIEDGLKVAPQNVFGSLTHDRGAALGLFTKFLPPGFYYDAFFKPKGSWPFWERIIRRFAGLGVLDPHRAAIPPSEKQNLFCEVAVVGGGISGMSAALAAADAGCEVILIEREPFLGGMAANARLGDAERGELDALARRVHAHAAITVLYNTTCAGWFEGNVLTAHGQGVYYHVRAGQVVAAAGVVEQPLVFRNNDLPGIILASTASLLMRGYGICPGRRAVVQTANRFGYEAALTLLDAGCEVAAILEMRDAAPDDALVAECRKHGVKIVTQSTVIEAKAGAGGRLGAIRYRRITGDGTVSGDTHNVACDTLIMSVAFSPLMQLVCHSGGEVVYDEVLASLRVSKTPERGAICGSLNGWFGFEHAAQDGVRAGRAAARVNVTSSEAQPDEVRERVNFPWTVFSHPKGKDFVDFDEDQTVSDIYGALDAGFNHMELMKRYTTVGMGPSQGRTTALNALKVFARAAGRDLSGVRITTQRPPFEPEPFANLAAECETPTRRTVLHDWHLAHGAVMMPAGSWSRPAFYGDRARQVDNINAEAMAVRDSVGLMDASTHGGFHLAGPDCDKLLAVAYINAFGDFRVGETRSALMTDELGAVVDDCVACRLSQQELYLVTSSGASAATSRKLRRLVIEHGLDVAISDLSGGMAILNLAGPKARSVLQTMACDIDLNDLPLHGFRRGQIEGVAVTVIRGDFVGETTFELHVGASHAVVLWDKLIAAGQAFGIRPFGVLSQRILRLEKGHAIIGQDTDHETTPDDINGAAKVALDKPYFVGKSAIEILRARGQRKYLRPFEAPGASGADAPDEFSLIEHNGEVVGRITSSEYSPKLGRIVGLVLIETGDVKPGDDVRVWRQNGGGARIGLLARAPYDPNNDRQANG